MVFAVGDDQEGLRPVLGGGREGVGTCSGAEGLQRRVDGGFEVSAGRGDELRLGHVKKEADGVVVGRQRALHEAVSGEQNQAHAIAAKGAQQRLDLVAGAVEPVRGHVFGKHRLRHVERDDEVDAFALDLADGRAEARSGQRHAEEPHRQHQQHRPGCACPAPHGPGQVAHEVAVSKRVQRLPPLPHSPCHQPHGQHHPARQYP